MASCQHGEEPDTVLERKLERAQLLLSGDPDYLRLMDEDPAAALEMWKEAVEKPQSLVKAPILDKPLTWTTCKQLSAQGYVPHTELYSGLWSNVSKRQLTFEFQVGANRRTDQSRFNRAFARNPGHVLATDHQSPRDREPRFQSPPIASCTHQESNESRSRG